MTSTRRAVAPTKLTGTLTPVTTLEGHDGGIQCMSYFPDGKRIISGSWDKTARQWDLQAGKEIVKTRDASEHGVHAVVVSRDGRWVITAGGDVEHGKLKGREVETGIVKKFQGHSSQITCIDVSPDNKLLASGSGEDMAVRIWSLNTGKLVAGPFATHSDWVGAVRFSQDSNKLAVRSAVGRCLQVWDVGTQTLDRRIGEKVDGILGLGSFAPIFWTNRKTILTIFSLTNGDPWSIYEFKTSRLKTFGTPFEGHTMIITGLALSFDGAILASASSDNTIKLWAFDSRELLASFDVLNLYTLILSPDSRQLAWASWSKPEIYICDVPLGSNIPLAGIGLKPVAAGPSTVLKTGATHKRLIDSDAISHVAVRHYSAIILPVTSFPSTPSKPMPTIPLPTIDSDTVVIDPIIHISSHPDPETVVTDSILHVSFRKDTFTPRDPLDSLLLGINSPSSQAITEGNSHVDHGQNSQSLPAPHTTLEVTSFNLQRSSVSGAFNEDLVPELFDPPSPTPSVFGIWNPRFRGLLSLPDVSPDAARPSNLATSPDMSSSLSSLPTIDPTFKVDSPPLLSSVQPELHSNLSMPPEAMLQDLTEYITKDEEYPAARGGFGEIWKCTYQSDQRLMKVAVKALMVYSADQFGEAKEKKIKRIWRELRICARLQHKNILPICGYTFGFGPLVAIVNPWAENGNLTAYLEHSGAALTVVRRFQILRDITDGLQYLHANNVIHGDFNGPNVLIYADGTACLADFGLSLMYSELVSTSQASWTSNLKGNLRWMAPELLGEREDGSPVRPSKESDTFSFGGIMLQVLTNKIPYYHLSNDAAIIRCIYTFAKPSRARYPAISDKYWHFLDQCWSAEPQERPSTKRLVDVIGDELDLLSSTSDT